MVNLTERSPLVHNEHPKKVADSDSSDDDVVHENVSSSSRTKYSRWQSMASVCFYVSVVGTTYAFGVYSELLKDNLGFSQSGLDIIASVGNTGLYLSLVAGFILETYGLKVTVIGGGFLIFFGFLYIYLAVQNFVSANIASISVMYFFSQFGVCCHVSSAVTYCVRLFPKEARGKAVGLGKGYFGLSSAVLGDFAGGFFASATTSFLLFTAIMIPTMSIIGASTANLIPLTALDFSYDRSRGNRTDLTPFFYHWLLLFVILFMVAYFQYVINASTTINTILSSVLAIVVVSIQVLPMFYGDRIVEFNADEPTLDTITQQLTMLMQDNESDNEKLPTDNATNKFEADNIRGNKDIADPSASGYTTFNRTLDRTRDRPTGSKECFYGNSMPLSKSFFTWRFWILYFTFLIMCGSGLMVIDNVNAISEAVGKTASSFFVALISLANGAGRITAGFTSDMLPRGFSKVQLLSLACFIMGLTQCVFAIGSSTLLYPCLIAAGFLFGSNVSLMAVCMADVFGSRFIATNFGATDSASIFGSYIFVTAIVSIFYSTNTIDDGGESSCVGTECFLYPFLINGISCFIASGLCVYLHVYTDMTKIMDKNANPH